MKIYLDINPPELADTIAKVKLVSEVDSCTLKMDYEKLKPITKIINEDLLDLQLLGNTVYAIDRWVSRKNSADNWTRKLSVTFPVYNPPKWQMEQDKLNKILTFLSGDKWRFDFEKRDSTLVFRNQTRLPMNIFDADTVSLFSGGLDSLVGVIDWLERNHNKKIILLGHHDPRIPGPYSDQIGVLKILKNAYPGRIKDILITVGADKGIDTTLRARSFLFIMTGIYIAKSLGKDVPLIVPENGTMALNFPLTPSRFGSCSTRTVHPFYMETLREFLNSFGIYNTILNPLRMKTKGEVLLECLNQEILLEGISKTTSCSKRGHTYSWINRKAKQCGMCIPCIYRRAALHHLGQDNEIYGRDFCKGEVEIFSEMKHADDFRAYLSFLRSNLSPFEIKRRLLINGKLPMEHLDEYANLVIRSGNEVRQLLKDKAVDEIKQQAGIE